MSRAKFNAIIEQQRITQQMCDRNS